MRLVSFLSLFLTIISCNISNNKIAKDFYVLSDLEGNAFDLDKQKGNVVILNIWATWCKPCIAEFESLEKVKEKFQDRNIKIIAVSNEDLKLINKFLDKRKYNLTSIYLLTVVVKLFVYFFYLVIYFDFFL